MNDEIFVPLPDMIRANAAARPDKLALIQDDRTLTYGALDASMDRVAATLQREGLAPGACVAICASTSLDYACVFLGALRAGVAVAPVAPTSPPDSIPTRAADV